MIERTPEDVAQFHRDLSRIARALICCEGPSCNNGIGARERESFATALVVGGDAVNRAERERCARGDVSRALAVTWHEPVGLGRGAAPIFTCQVCGHERQFGGTLVWGR